MTNPMLRQLGVAALLLALVVLLSACQTRSISDSGYAGDGRGS